MTEPSNFRPVSLTSVPCKMMESIIIWDRSRNINWMKTKAIVVNEQLREGNPACNHGTAVADILLLQTDD